MCGFRKGSVPLTQRRTKGLRRAPQKGQFPRGRKNRRWPRSWRRVVIPEKAASCGKMQSSEKVPSVSGTVSGFL